MKKTYFTAADLCRLSSNGLELHRQTDQSFMHDAEFCAQVELVCRFAKDHLHEYRGQGLGRKAFKSGSYGLKHDIEKAFGTYISNTATIVGLHKSGVTQYYTRGYDCPNTRVVGRYYSPDLFNDRGEVGNKYQTSGSAVDVVAQLHDLEALYLTFKRGYAAGGIR